MDQRDMARVMIDCKYETCDRLTNLVVKSQDLRTTVHANTYQ